MFVLAVLVLCFLFLNLVLAVVYNEYSEHFKDRMKSFYAARSGKLQKAFKSLCPSGEMSRPQLDRVVAELNKSDVVAEVPPAMVDYLWARLDRDASGEISAREFMELCDVLACEYKVLRTRSCRRDGVPGPVRERALAGASSRSCAAPRTRARSPR